MTQQPEFYIGDHLCSFLRLRVYDNLFFPPFPMYPWVEQFSRSTRTATKNLFFPTPMYGKSIHGYDPRAYRMSNTLLFHIVISIFTLSVLCMAGLLAILLAFQEYWLRNKLEIVLKKIPPLESLEKLLFQLNSLGFVLLNVLLITSLYCYYSELWHHLILLQKTTMVIIAWLIFALLLIGRISWGWRGKKAIYCTLSGVTLLGIVYLGSKLVLEAMH